MRPAAATIVVEVVKRCCAVLHRRGSALRHNPGCSGSRANVCATWSRELRRRQLAVAWSARRGGRWSKKVWGGRSLSDRVAHSTLLPTVVVYKPAYVTSFYHAQPSAVTKLSN